MVKEATKHIWEAQHYPDLTLPTARNKSIPGSIESNEPLQRLYGDSNGHNRSKSTAACRKYYGKRYGKLPNGPWDCDEYPFASTWQGAFTGDNDTRATSHFSARLIPSADNQQGGRELDDWYREQRIIDHDDFFVKVVKADGSEMVLPAPPPPHKGPGTMGDMNSDGKSDLVAVHSDGSGKLRFYPGNGDGTLGGAKEISSAGWAGAAISHGGDFNSDGKQDVVARVGNELRLYPGQGDGTVGTPRVFNSGTEWDTSISKIITVEDADGDDYPDVITPYDNKLWLYPGDPNNEPGLKDPIQIGGAGWDKFDLISLDDVNGDGHSDLGARNRNDGMSYFYPGPLNRDLSQRTAMIREQSGDRATTRLYDGAGMPLITSGHDADDNGRMDMWATTWNGKLVHIKDDLAVVDESRPSDSSRPWITYRKEVGAAGWQNIKALG